MLRCTCLALLATAQMRCRACELTLHFLVAQPTPSAPTDPDRRFVDWKSSTDGLTCPYPGCKYKATRKGHLIQHRQTHTGEKNFKCTFEGCEYRGAPAPLPRAATRPPMISAPLSSRRRGLSHLCATHFPHGVEAADNLTMAQPEPHGVSLPQLRATLRSRSISVLTHASGARRCPRVLVARPADASVWSVISWRAADMCRNRGCSSADMLAKKSNTRCHRVTCVRCAVRVCRPFACPSPGCSYAAAQRTTLSFIGS